LLADTARETPDDIHSPGQEPVLNDQRSISLIPKSTVLLLGREEI